MATTTTTTTIKTTTTTIENPYVPCGNNMSVYAQ